MTLANVGRKLPDSLNRAVTVAYSYDSNPHLDYDQISFKGTGWRGQNDPHLEK